MTEHFPKWPLWASLIAYFLLTAALIAIVPLGASPDEAAHWQYVEHIVQTGRLPVFQGVAPPAPGYEFHQPPLYYLLCAPFWKVMGAGVQNYACRAVSLFCGAATLWAIWGAARLLFPNRWRIAALSTALAALWPLHQGVSAGSNNDGLGGLVGAVLFYLTARCLLRGAIWRDAWQIGIVAGIGIWTKNTTLAISFVAFIALFIAARRKNSQVWVLATLGIMLIVGSPILIRNQILYGDPLALRVFSSAATAGTPGFPQFSQIGLSFLDYARGMIWMIFLTLWGFFGGPDSAAKATGPLSVAGPRIAQLWLLLPIVICLLAPLGAILGWRRRLEDEDIVPLNTIYSFWGLGVLFVLLAWAQFAYNHFSGGQARYLHGALLPFCILGTVGWVSFWGEGRALKIASAVFGLTLIFLTLLNLFVWKTLV
jgi:hypothetical protein